MDTLAVLIISEGVTPPMMGSVVYSLLMYCTFVVSDAFDIGNPSGKVLLEIIGQTLLFGPMIVLACLPPIMAGIAVKSWRYRFSPTARMVWQEAKEKADLRRKVLRKINRSPQLEQKLIKKNRSVMEQRASFVYRPDRLKEE